MEGEEMGMGWRIGIYWGWGGNFLGFTCFVSLFTKLLAR